MVDVWYSPGEIVFNREQMLWLLEHLDVIRAGRWPANPEGSSYVDPIVHVQARRKAPFETPAQIYGEVSDRLEATGQAGEELLHQVQSGLNDVELLSPFARSALNYMSGWPRRRMCYSDWVRQRKYREKVK